jgi:ribonuclease HIII
MLKLKFKDKFECYDYYRKMIVEKGGETGEYREINYGIQFQVKLLGESHTIRVYESKKNGVRADLSLVKSEGFRDMMLGKSESLDKEKKNTPLSPGMADIDENEIIGTDESGKGDYFGPLVIAGVYADEKTKKILKTIGVDDSKKLKDDKISSMASEIKSICTYDIVTIGNAKYNELYGRIDNLNKLLAWGHARVIENMLEKVSCGIVLSDQFGSPELIKSALMNKGRSVHLEQRPRAEENIVVAAASILARNEFVERMDRMSREYGINFPKGASNRTVLVGKEFVEKYGKERLAEVAKLHFKTTLSI